MFGVMPKITFTPPGHAPLKYRLDREVVKVGRADDCDAQIAFGGVSNYHAELLQIRTGYMIVDKGSTNGIKIDGDMVHSAELEHGSIFYIGDIEALYELYPDELETVLDGDELYPDASVTHAVPKGKKEAGSEAKAGARKRESDDDDDDPLAPPPPPMPPEPPRFGDEDDEDEEDRVSVKGKGRQPAPAPPPPPPPPPGFLDEDEDDYDEDLAPPPPAGSQKAERPRDKPKPVHQGGAGVFVFLCILVTIFAVMIGLTIRHYKETGRILWKDLLQRTERVPAD